LPHIEATDASIYESSGQTTCGKNMDFTKKHTWSQICAPFHVLTRKIPFVLLRIGPFFPFFLFTGSCREVLTNDAASSKAAQAFTTLSVKITWHVSVSVSSFARTTVPVALRRALLPKERSLRHLSTIVGVMMGRMRQKASLTREAVVSNLTLRRNESTETRFATFYSSKHSWFGLKRSHADRRRSQVKGICQSSHQHTNDYFTLIVFSRQLKIVRTR